MQLPPCLNRADGLSVFLYLTTGTIAAETTHVKAVLFGIHFPISVLCFYLSIPGSAAPHPLKKEIWGSDDDDTICLFSQYYCLVILCIFSGSSLS